MYNIIITSTHVANSKSKWNIVVLKFMKIRVQDKTMKHNNRELITYTN